ncbi:MAG: hypothetical protein JXA25_20660 [Anaerolineales bacterium]|nr:hypothetical protein [Anaerolineales bacterium]
MFRFRKEIFFVILLIAVSCACRFLPARQSDAPDAVQLNEEAGMPDFGNDFPEMDIPGIEAAEWPAYLPSDMPELKGDISTVMVARESHVRIFYEKVEEGVILAYLNQLENAGYSLEYLVYAAEGFESSAEERAAAGEYDAVDISNGTFHMRLEYGAGTAVYDIYIQGFSVPDDPPLTWPDDLKATLPEPPQCSLLSADQTGSGSYRIRCRPESESVGTDYVLLLQENGFTESDCSEIVYEYGQSYTLSNENLCVTVIAGLGTELQIQVEQDSGSQGNQWPTNLVDAVPEPGRVSIVSVMSPESRNHLITVLAEDSDVLQDYILDLEEAGFNQVDIFEGMDGQILSITLSDGVWVIEMMASPMDLQIMLRIYQE